MQTKQVATGFLDIPLAADMPKGSIVLMSTNGTQKRDLVMASTFWMLLVFGVGVFVGTKLKKGKK